MGTSGLLRLPPELRVRIYTILSYELGEAYPRWTVDSFYPTLYRLEITRVCQIIREESIPIMYGRLHWKHSASISEPVCETSRAWLDIVDPYALRYMKSEIALYFFHCCFPQEEEARSSGYFSHLEIYVTKDGIKATGNSSGCCEKSADFDKRFRKTVQRSEKAVKDDPDNMKWEIPRLIKDVYKSLSRRE